MLITKSKKNKKNQIYKKKESWGINFEAQAIFLPINTGLHNTQKEEGGNFTHWEKQETLTLNLNLSLPKRQRSPLGKTKEQPPPPAGFWFFLLPWPLPSWSSSSSPHKPSFPLLNTSHRSRPSPKSKSESAERDQPPSQPISPISFHYCCRPATPEQICLPFPPTFSFISSSHQCRPHRQPQQPAHGSPQIHAISFSHQLQQPESSAVAAQLSATWSEGEEDVNQRKICGEADLKRRKPK